ncbi:MAG TPA: hypothetical protein VNJ29_02615 [Candidatus Nitrosotenuis sp.]|jgi:hypothetical protein|nr:hypothetical protein [Candidatus Nitrosotenuis sp.]
MLTNLTTTILSLTLFLTNCYTLHSQAMETSSGQSITWSGFDNERKELTIAINAHRTQCVTTACNFYDSLSSTVDMIKYSPELSLKTAEYLAPLALSRSPLLLNWDAKVALIYSKMSDSDKQLLSQKINDSFARVFRELLSIEAEFQRQCAQIDINSLDLAPLLRLIKNFKEQTIPQCFGGHSLSAITHWLWPEIEILEKPKPVIPTPILVTTSEIQEESYGLKTESPDLSSSPPHKKQNNSDFGKIEKNSTTLTSTPPKVLPVSNDNKPIVAQFLPGNHKNGDKVKTYTLPKPIDLKRDLVVKVPPKSDLELQLEADYQHYGWTKPYPSAVIEAVPMPFNCFSISNITREQQTLQVLCDVVQGSQTTPCDLIITKVTLPQKTRAVYRYEPKKTKNAYITLAFKEIFLFKDQDQKELLFSRNSHDVTDYNSFTTFILTQGTDKSQLGRVILRGIDCAPSIEKMKT